MEGRKEWKKILCKKLGSRQFKLDMGAGIGITETKLLCIATIKNQVCLLPVPAHIRSFEKHAHLGGPSAPSLHFPSNVHCSSMFPCSYCPLTRHLALFVQAGSVLFASDISYITLPLRALGDNPDMKSKHCGFFFLWRRANCLGSAGRCSLLGWQISLQGQAEHAQNYVNKTTLTLEFLAK
jgi:hypothetical protein